MFKIVRTKEWNRMKTDNETLSRTLKRVQEQLDEKERRCFQLEMSEDHAVWRMKRMRKQLLRSRRDTKRMIWSKVHKILMEKEYGVPDYSETCGCYYNPENGKWEVVTARHNGSSEADRVLFREAADAKCYYALMRAFGVQPGAETYRAEREETMESA